MRAQGGLIAGGALLGACWVLWQVGLVPIAMLVLGSAITLLSQAATAKWRKS